MRGMLATTPPPAMTPHEPSPCCCLPPKYTFLQFFSLPLHLLLVRLLPRPLRLRAAAAVVCMCLSLSSCLSLPPVIEFVFVFSSSSLYIVTGVLYLNFSLLPTSAAAAVYVSLLSVLPFQDSRHGSVLMLM